MAYFHQRLVLVLSMLLSLCSAQNRQIDYLSTSEAVSKPQMPNRMKPARSRQETSSYQVPLYPQSYDFEQSTDTSPYSETIGYPTLASREYRTTFYDRNHPSAKPLEKVGPGFGHPERTTMQPFFYSSRTFVAESYTIFPSIPSRMTSVKPITVIPPKSSQSSRSFAPSSPIASSSIKTTTISTMTSIDSFTTMSSSSTLSRTTPIRRSESALESAPISDIATTTGSALFFGRPPNRIRGKPHVVCKEDGIDFRAQTLFPFVGQVFARDQRDDPSCTKRFDGAHYRFDISFSYERCGQRQSDVQPGDNKYYVQVVVSYENETGTRTIQSYLARCLNQRIRYKTEQIPRRIEAIEELQLIPIKLEQKANIPQCRMRVVLEPEEHHGYGPSDGKEVDDVTIGQELRIEWNLEPASEAYGFHVRNCTVKDKLSGQEYLLIDENGCSTDINILSHPHYDTYHDLAIVHWHAFKVPDNALLTIRCGFAICSEIPDKNGVSNCDDIPTPPFCPDLVTAPLNSLLSFDLGNNAISKHEVDRFQVRTDMCISDNRVSTVEYCHLERRAFDQLDHGEATKTCMSKVTLWTTVTLTMLTTTTTLGIYLALLLGHRARISTRPLS